MRRARYWLLRDERGAVVGSTGFELAAPGADALIRSVAVASGSRASGLGSKLALFAETGQLAREVAYTRPLP